MELATEPDLYYPSIDDNGNYIDYLPSFNQNVNGYYCSCGCRKDKIYQTKQKLLIHHKTKCHQKWLINLNQNKTNYYIENVKMKELIHNQQKIIATISNTNINKSATIDYLTSQLLLIENYKSSTAINIDNLINL